MVIFHNLAPSRQEQAAGSGPRQGCGLCAGRSAGARVQVHLALVALHNSLALENNTISIFWAIVITVPSHTILMYVWIMFVRGICAYGCAPKG